MTLHRLFNWVIAALVCVLMGLTWHLDDHAADLGRTDAERAAQTEARLQKAAQDLCLQEAGRLRTVPLERRVRRPPATTENEYEI